MVNIFVILPRNGLGEKYITTNTNAISWNNEIVDSAGDVGQDSSIAITSQNEVQISYHDESGGNQGLKYAYRSAGNIPWTIEQMDWYMGTGHYTSIAIDSSDGLNIICCGINGVKHAYQATHASGTVVATVDPTVLTVETALALDKSDNGHACYIDATKSPWIVKYAYCNKGSWNNETVDSVSDAICTSIAIDNSNVIHISYVDITNYDLKHAYKPKGPGSWTIETVDSADNSYPQIAVDSADNIHIVYLDQSYNQLGYAYLQSGSGSWQKEIIGQTSNAMYPSIAIDKSNGIHLCFIDSNDWTLKYAYKPAGFGSKWTVDTVDSSGVCGPNPSATSIALNTTDGIHISYYDAVNRQLKYANGQMTAVPEFSLPNVIVFGIVIMSTVVVYVKRRD